MAAGQKRSQCDSVYAIEMPSARGENWEKYQKKFADDEPEEKKITPLTDEYAHIISIALALH